MGDSGAVFTTETIRNSELKNAIFKIFALKLVELTSIKVLAKKSENKHGFQNFFCAFEMYENTDFCIQKIFLLRSFFDHFFQKKLIKKWPEPKKLLILKISLFMPLNHAKEFLKSFHYYFGILTTFHCENIHWYIKNHEQLFTNTEQNMN